VQDPRHRGRHARTASHRQEFKDEAKRRGVKLVILKTREAVEYFLKNYGPDINAIFHITC
jgi:hypothetical protein